MSRAAAKSIYRGGFEAPVLDAQSVFRQIMNALARPGNMCPIGAFAAPPEPLSSSVGAIAATLLDGDTSVWMDPDLKRHTEVVDWLKFHTAARFVEQADDAQFAIIGNSANLPSLESFAQGTQDYPDRSTTIIVQVNGFDGDTPLTLTGPGIKDSTIITPVGLPRHFCEQWSANQNLFPRGVDMLLAADDAVIGLPRTSRVQRADKLEG